MQLCLLSNVEKHIASTADKCGPTQRECYEASQWASGLLSRGTGVSDHKGYIGVMNINFIHL
jgi:hypothetical protein